MSSDDEKGYQGWTNYETWCVALWIDNEEPLYKQTRSMAKCAIRDAREDEEQSILTPSERTLYYLEGELKDLVEDAAPRVDGMFSDLLTSAIQNVNYREIAESILAEVQS